MKRKISMPKQSPILLIQWLANADEGQEAEAAFENFRSKFDVTYTDIEVNSGGKELIYKSLLSWATNNPNCQSIYIGCHGFNDRIGPTASRPTEEEGITYHELWSWLQKAHQLHRKACRKDAVERRELFPTQRLKADEGRFDLWLGACCSASAKMCWTPLCELSAPIPVQAIIGFEDKPKSKDVATFLNALMEQQELSSSTWAGNTWALLKECLPNNMPAVYYLDNAMSPTEWQRPHDFS